PPPNPLDPPTNQRSEPQAHSLRAAPQTREPRRADMTNFLRHLKANAVAYLALFVALGGTSYAALQIPAGSVGARQLENHSIAPIKFDRSQIGAYVRYWAEISAQGTVVASRPSAHLVGWHDVPSGTLSEGL